MPKSRPKLLFGDMLNWRAKEAFRIGGIFYRIRSDLWNMMSWQNSSRIFLRFVQAGVMALQKKETVICKQQTSMTGALG